MAVRQIPNLTPVVFLSPSAQFEIVQDGVTYRTSAQQIADLGQYDITIFNDIIDNTRFFPVFAKATNTDVTAIYTSDPHYNYIPAEGRLISQRVEASQSLFLNSNALTLDYSIPVGDNAMSTGPVTLSAILTVPTGSVWAVI